MIPKVNPNKFSPELLEDEQAYRTRPEWFKFFYGAWLLSTQTMDDKQRGWYIQLLTWAATEGDPPGFLPSDEDELKQIAGCEVLPQEVSYLLGMGAKIPEAAMVHVVAERERKWQKVRRKFISDPEDEDLVFNPRLIKALKQAYNNKLRITEMGIAGAKVRWAGNRKRKKRKMALAIPDEAESQESQEYEESLLENGVDYAKSQMPRKKELMADAMPSSMPSPMAINLSLLSSLEGDQLSSLGDSFQKSEEITLELIELVSEAESLGEETNNSESQTELGEEKGGPAGKKRRLPETFFDENKWVITAKMKAHLLTKYLSDGIEMGDVEHLGEKFILVHHNSKYARWAMAFYNFVDNQLTKYGYEFGAYKRKGKRHERPAPTIQSSSDGKPWERQESSADRNARLEDEADEYTRQLRSRGSGLDSENQKGLPLAADDLS